jgi:hypothetical protein
MPILLFIKMTQQSLLLVAWYFPPDGGAGSQRPCSFARHLPDLGWKTTVMTRGEDHPRSRLSTRDDSLLADTGTHTQIHRVSDVGPIPNAADWFETAIAHTAGPFCRELASYSAAESPDLILISMSPFVLSKAIGPIQSSSSSRIVLDLRDPWALDYWPPFKRGVQRDQLRLMRDVFSRVDGVVMNTEEAKLEVLSVLGPDLPKDFPQRISVVQNGYSAVDFSAGTPVVDEQLRIVHAGTFLCDQLKSRRTFKQRLGDHLKRRSRGRIDRTARTPFYLLQAAGLLKKTDPDIFRALKFEFIGHADDHLRACVDQSPCPEKVEITGYLPHSQMIQRIQSAPALFLPCGQLDDSIRELIVPGKTYEYLAACRPILAALHPGDALDLINASGGGYPCRPCCNDSIASSLRDLHQDWVNGEFTDLHIRRREFLEQFERGRLAEKLSDFLGKIMSLPRVRDPR